MQKKSELSRNFYDLFAEYSSTLEFSSFTGSTRKDLMEAMPKDKRGVYSFWKKGSDRPIYIGCAGKISEKNLVSGNTIRARVFQASTPYHFDKTDHVLRYLPTSAGVPPAGYNNEISLDYLEIKTLFVPESMAPSVLEHLLIQGFVNEFGELPEANQEL